MGKNTSITLGNHFDDFIKNSVTNGRYKNASEVVRAGLRLLENEESKILILRKAINEGIESGINEAFDPTLHLKDLKKKRGL